MSDPGAEVEVQHARKSFGRIAALRDVSLTIAPHEAVAITGRSGSGKSTLLALIGGLERPDAGQVLIDGEPIWQRRHSTRIRREVVGFVFQRHLLLESLSAQANVEVPLLGAGVSHRERKARALKLLEEVGLADRAEHIPSQLSGGERQRVAVARAIANEPRLLLADEPTGALDSMTSERILDLLFGLRDRLGTTMIVVSYDGAVGVRADRRVTLIDGAIVADDGPTDAEQRPRHAPDGGSAAPADGDSAAPADGDSAAPADGRSAKQSTSRSVGAAEAVDELSCAKDPR